MLSRRILLGLPTNHPKTKDRLTDPFAIRLGGLPIGLDPFYETTIKIFQNVKNCDQIMPLILQTRACIDHVNYDRVIYVWACCNKYCQYKEGSVRAIRGVLYEKTKNFKIKHSQNNNLHIDCFSNLGDSLFKTSNLPLSHASNSFQINSPTRIEEHFSVSLNLTNQSNTKSSQTNFLLTQNPSQFEVEIGENEEDEWPNDSKILQYPVKFLYIAEENEPNHKEFTKKLDMKDIEEKFVKEGENEWSEETYEKSTLEKGFNIFTKKVISNPQQCVRYNRKGEPLYYSFTDSLVKKIKSSKSTNPLGKCQLCDSQNVFELQIMPNTINILEEDSSLGDMLWGTILIGTCGIGYAEEWAGVQWENMRK
ncbi:unnamed protein product [Pneumocystis jirovecii]|uniref:Programmed cell death protein 2 C-terminal domain-containing protein n=1 Tax=Pneumocystis jirovecii TaxID=42068 RepID=L0PGK1_PNEJI|nr:unnamed protein product [Pneumocystis jirovecii]